MVTVPVESGRYGSQEMIRIFDEETKLQRWLDVESAVAKAQASVGDIHRDAAEEIAENANIKTVTLARTKEIEKEIHHDLMSMVIALTEACTGDGKKYVHYGLTSSDIEDTALALQFKEALNILTKELKLLEATLTRMVRKRLRFELARTQNGHARVVALGPKLALWLAEVKRHRHRLKQVRERVLVGKILGVVGTGAGMGRNALRIQEMALKGLGLKPAGLVTQVVQRDIHAELVAGLALLGSSLDKFATEIRNLPRSELVKVLGGVYRENRGGNHALRFGQTPVLGGTVSSLARLLRGLVIPAMENVPLWHERDLSNSANERFLFPMSFILSDGILRLFLDALKQIKILPDETRA